MPEPLTRVAVYEIATGRFACGTAGIPHVCSLSWAPLPPPRVGTSFHRTHRRHHVSSLGRHTPLRLAIGCFDGTLMVMRAPPHAQANVADAAARGSLNSDVRVRVVGLPWPSLHRTHVCACCVGFSFGKPTPFSFRRFR